MNFTNATVNIKDGVEVDLDKLNTTKLYGKLMMIKGSKFEEVVKSPRKMDFLLSDKGNHYRAEPFTIGRSGQVISVESKLWCNVDTTSKIMVDTVNRMFWVELIPLQFIPSQSIEVVVE